MGSRRHVRYLDSHGNRISDDSKLARIESLRIPPAWTDVWISPNASAKLQATGVDSAGRRQYLYHPEHRAAQEQAKYDRLVRFAEKLPEIRVAMGEHMLVARDVVGVEPVGGVYRPLAGDRRARGMLRAGEGLEGFAKQDELDEQEFWAQVEEARGTATRLAGRIREGDVRHDPRGGECPSWCELWTMCRVARP